MQARSPEWALWEWTRVQVGKCTGLGSALPGGLQGDLRAFFSDFQWACLIQKEEMGSALKRGYILKPLDG